MNYFILASTVIFLLLALIWKSNSWQNTLAKYLMWIMSIWGVVESLTVLGYVVRVIK